MALQRPINPEDMEAYRRVLGEIIFELRKPTSNQDDFADRVGVYRSHMGKIEQGKLDLRLSTLLGIAHALDLPLSELLHKVEERRKQQAD